VREVVVKVATPLATVPEPSVVEPSRNVTVPEAVSGARVAVNVTDAPNVEGFSDDVRVVVVAALLTTCETAEDVLVV
jgi:hypothetical protein